MDDYYRISIPPTATFSDANYELIPTFLRKEVISVPTDTTHAEEAFTRIRINENEAKVEAGKR